MWWKAFSSGETQAFARRVAEQILHDLDGARQHTDRQFKVRADKALARAERDIRTFKAQHRVNWFQRARAANAFLWTLRDGGCPPDYADELARWFVLRV